MGKERQTGGVIWQSESDKELVIPFVSPLWIAKHPLGWIW